MKDYVESIGSTPTANPIVNNGLRVIIMGQYGFISCKNGLSGEEH